MKDHIECVERRVARLRSIGSDTALDREAGAFVREELQPLWQRTRARLLDFGKSKIEMRLANEERCLSPSDFGFHNALLAADGRVRFFDFEYAGWDDPAKLVCDFFCQPDIPAGLGHWEMFVDGLIESSVISRDSAERATELLPAYQVKWCCIVLNDFVPGDQVRREFSLGEDVESRKSGQLRKARRTVES